MSCTECPYVTTHCSVKGDMQDRFAYLVPKWKEQFKVSVLGEMEQFKWELDYSETPKAVEQLEVPLVFEMEHVMLCMKQSTGQFRSTTRPGSLPRVPC